MAVKASVTITISKYRDTDNITRYYKLQSSSASIPTKPTSLSPSGWTDTEPSYTSGSTNTLYLVDRYIFSDGTYQYTEVSKSSSYEAAKEAYNKAQAAQNSASDANDKIDDLCIGGTNFIRNSLDSNLSSVSGTKSSNKIDILLEKIEPNKEYTLSFEVIANNFKGTNYGFESVFTNGIDKFTISKYLSDSNLSGRVYCTFTTPEWINDETFHDFYPSNELYPSNGLYPLGGETIDTKGCFYVNKQTGGSIILQKPKLELGNRQSDWSPAPEDIDAAIEDRETKEEVEKIRKNLQEQVTSAKQMIDSINGIIQNLVIDKDGQTLMEQTSNGWVFKMDNITSVIEKIAEDLQKEGSDRSSSVDELLGLIDELNKKTAYVNITTNSSGDPNLILGRQDSDFKLVISNSTINFMNGSSIPAYINGDIFYGQNITAKNQLKIGESSGYIWQKRANGNLGLIYTE